MTDIGRAGMVMKGDYNSASTYETLDAVSYQNGLYIAKQNVPAGTLPTNTTYWQEAVSSINIVSYSAGPIGSSIDFTKTVPYSAGEYGLIGYLIYDGSNVVQEAVPGPIFSGMSYSGNTISITKAGSASDWGNWNLKFIFAKL